MNIFQAQDTSTLSELLNLYIECFDNQQHNIYKLKNYIRQSLNNHCVWLAMEDNRTVGALMFSRNLEKELLPTSITQNYDLKSCLYISELMVSPELRGHKIGNNLLSAFIQSIDNKIYTDILIRVWDKNTPALTLYKNLGFSPLTSIEQTKTTPDGSSTFVMKKIYLQRKTT
jgi:ribosomal protein S18 acetylase RimI-like enzyme